MNIAHLRLGSFLLPWRVAAAVSIFAAAALVPHPAIAQIPNDNDHDNMGDAWETLFGLDDNNPADATLNGDSDAWLNVQEAAALTDPTRPDTDLDGWSDPDDAVPLSRAVIYWGLRPFLCDNGYWYPGPAWCTNAWKEAGVWLDPQPEPGDPPHGVEVLASKQPGQGKLHLVLNRALLTNNLALRIDLLDSPGAQLYADLLDAAGQPVVTNFAGNLLAGSGTNRTLRIDCPLAAHPAASSIRLRRGSGYVRVYTCVLYIDEDGDELDASQEAQLGTSDYAADTDNDGLSDPAELALGTSPTDADSDDDGLADGAEVNTHHTDPFDPDSDNDLLNDGPEVALGADPLNPDTDRDGLADGVEVHQYGTSPVKADTDNDGLSDPAEIQIHRTNPLSGDTDADGCSDGVEVNDRQSDPLVADRPDLVTVNPLPYVLPATGVMYEWWTNISGSAVTSLTASSLFQEAPVGHSVLTDLVECPTNWGDRYGQRLRAVFVPPVSGEYRFLIASDDQSELRVGPLEQAMPVVATVPGYTLSQQWDKYTNQLSAPLALEAGAPYYLQALMKENAGKDNLAIGIRFPDGSEEKPVSAARFLPAPSFRGPTPAAPCLIEAEDFDWGGEGRGYHDGDTANQGGEWRPEEGVDIESCADIAGGHNVGWTRPGEWLAYTLDVPRAGPYALTLRVAAPQSGALHLELGGTNLTGAMAVPSTGAWQNWTSLVSRIALPAGRHTLRVVMEAGSIGFNRFALRNEDGLLNENWTGIAGKSVPDLTGLDRFPEVPDRMERLSPDLETASDIGDNYGQRVTGVFHAPRAGDYTFWLATDDYGELRIDGRLIASVIGWASPRQWEKYPAQRSAPVALAADGLHPLEVLMKENTGHDNLAVAVRFPDGRLEAPVRARWFETPPAHVQPGVDSDNDGLLDHEEWVLGTDPASADSDNDGIPDGQEELLGSDPLDTDSDNDGLSDGQELTLGSDPLKPDSDGDGLLDGEEVAFGTSPTLADTDSDELKDGDEIALYQTDPLLADTDGDTIKDGEEVFIYGTDPLDADTDSDGMADGWELDQNFNPLIDSDGLAAAMGEYGVLTQTQTNALEWQAVTLQRTYRNPVVMVGPLTTNSFDPAMVRVRNVTSKGFEYKIDEWDKYNGMHDAETFGYLVVEEGDHTLADGRLLQAGTLYVSDQWKAFPFQRPFPRTPVVLATPQTTDVNLNLRTNITISAWIRPDRFNNYAGVIVKGQDKAPYALQLWSDGSLRFMANQYAPWGATGSGAWNSTTKLALGQWHHVAVTYDGARIRFYINGQKDANEPATNLVFGVYESPLIMGCDFPGGDEYFKGAIQDVRIYDRPLADAEMATLAAPREPPAGWWPLREGRGAVASEYVIGCTGTVKSGVSWISDAAGPVAYFDGSAGHIAVSNSAHLNVSNVTIAAWIKPDRFNAWAGIVTKGVEKAPYALHLWSDGALRFNANQYGPAGAVGGGYWNSTRKLSLARWQHVAATYDGAKVRFYIDGQLDREVTTSLVLGSTDEPLVLGCDFPGGNEYYKGAMRDVRVYGRALPAAEIAALASPIPGLAGWWPLGERTSAIYDLSGHENHGSVQNGVMWTDGLYGPAVYLNGSNAYARCGSGKHDAAAVRLRNATRGGVEARLQEQESADQAHHYEKLGWVAIEPGAGDFLAGLTPAAVTDQPYGFLFERAFASAPVFVGQAQTYAGGDPIVLRLAALGPEGATVFVQEETSKDSETAHGTPESVGYVALPGDSGVLRSVPDADDDGISNVGEFLRGSDPHDGDGDLDGLTDDEEYLLGTNPRSTDSDGDGTPDAWEVQFGFDATNRPSYDVDGDGLTNLEEYNAGTDPLRADSDNDGLEDGLELIGLLTDPLAPDALPLVTLATLNGSDSGNRSGPWNVKGTDAINYAGCGSVEFAFELAAPRVCIFDLVCRAATLGAPTNRFPLTFTLDGRRLRTSTLTTYAFETGKLRLTGPMLGAGAHTLRVDWQRTDYYSTLAIRSLAVMTLDGADNDGDGLPDWMLRWTDAFYSLHSPATTSCVSPAFIEGAGDAAVVSIPDVPVEAGAGARWYANVPLDPTGLTAVAVSLCDGARATTNAIEWVPLNALDGGSFLLRADDTLRLAARPAGATEGQSFIDIPGVTNAQFSAGGHFDVCFPEGGEWAISVRYQNGAEAITNTLNLKAVFAAFDGSPVLWPGHLRVWDNPWLPPEAVIEADPCMQIAEAPLSPSGRRLTLDLEQPIEASIVARLGTNGPVIARATVRGLEVLSTISTYVQVVETLPDGTRIVETPVVLGRCDADVTVRLSIFVGGVTFEDGTTEKILTAADFDEFGVCKVRFIYPKNQPTSICHRLYVYQNGQLIGQR